MERTKYQKALMVISIINIVFGVFGLLGGILFGMLGSVAASSTIEGMSASEQTMGAVGLGVTAGVSIVAGIVSVVGGILGIRAAKDAQKITPAWILSFAGISLSVIQLVMSIAGGSFGILSLVPLVVPGLTFWFANGVKEESEDNLR